MTRPSSFALMFILVLCNAFVFVWLPLLSVIVLLPILGLVAFRSHLHYESGLVGLAVGAFFASVWTVSESSISLLIGYGLVALVFWIANMSSQVATIGGAYVQVAVLVAVFHATQVMFQPAIEVVPWFLFLLLSIVVMVGVYVLLQRISEELERVI